MTRMLCSPASTRAKSDDVQAVVKSLEGLENERHRRADAGRRRHAPDAASYFFLRCKPKAAMKHELDFADVIATGDAPLPKEYAACKDIGSF